MKDLKTRIFPQDATEYTRDQLAEFHAQYAAHATDDINTDELLYLEKHVLPKLKEQRTKVLEDIAMQDGVVYEAPENSFF